MTQPPVVQGKVVGRSADIEQPHPHRAAVHPMPQPEHMEVMQLSCRDACLPPDIRLGFVKKVYGIVGMMLVLTFGTSLPFVFATKATLDFFQQHVWILYIVAAVVLAQLVFDLAMSCQMCCGGSSLLQSYFWMMKTAPWNYLYLTTFSLCFGVLVGFICAKYTAQSVVLVFALTVVMIIALTIYAVRTKADFTGCGAYIMVFFLGRGMYGVYISGNGKRMISYCTVEDVQSRDVLWSSSEAC